MKKLARAVPQTLLQTLLITCIALPLAGPVLAQDRAAPVPAAAAQIMDPDVLAIFGDKRITRLDFDAAMQRVPEQSRSEFRRQIKRITNMLEGILLNRSLAAEARAGGLEKDPVVQRHVELAVEEALAKARINILRKNVIVPDLTVAAQEHYRLNKEKYRDEARVNAAHILISTEKRTDQEALDRAKLVLAKLRAGEKLADLAVDFSDDPTAAENKGGLGFFGKGRMVKEFEAAAMALKTPGQIADPVKTKFGYHIIQLIERQDERQRSFDQVKEAILGGLEREYIDRELAEYAAKILSSKDIRLNTKAIDGLQTFLPVTKHTH